MLGRCDRQKDLFCGIMTALICMQMVPKKEIKTASWPNWINKSIVFFLLIICSRIPVFARNAYLKLLNQCHRITYLRRVNAFTDFFLCERSKFMASTLLMQMSFHQGMWLLLAVVQVTSSLIYAVFLWPQHALPPTCNSRRIPDAIGDIPYRSICRAVCINEWSRNATFVNKATFLSILEVYVRTIKMFITCCTTQLITKEDCGPRIKTAQLLHSTCWIPRRCTISCKTGQTMCKMVTFNHN